MDPWTIIGGVALVVGMVAGVVQVLDYVQRVREKRQGQGQAAPTQTAGTVTQQVAAKPAADAAVDQPVELAEPASNLPVASTPLVGREDDVARVVALIKRSDVRLLTLTGPGGVGKSRIALRAAEELADSLPGGAAYVPLADVADPALLASTVARALGVKESGSQPVIGVLKAHLRGREMLLVLDNFEQTAEGAPFVAQLLASAPRLKVLATGRSALRISGEREMPVQPLALPDPAHLPPLDELARNPAVALYLDRARAVKPDFALTAENSRAIAEICSRLDGLPLAIELAAARSRLLTPQAALERLKGSLQLLSSGARDLPARQQTLYSAIAWSYDLLKPAEQTLFRRLSVFVGGCFLDAAEVVCGRGVGDPGSGVGNEPGSIPDPRSPTPTQIDILDGLESLLDKSLLRQSEAWGEMRFGMLRTIRDFGVEHLGRSDEADTIRARHASYYLALAEEAEPKLTGPEQARWLDRLEIEHDNIRAALDWDMQQGDAESALRLAGALLWFWQTRGYLSEGRERLNAILPMPGAEAHPAARSKALLNAGRLATLQGDYDAARAHFDENLAIQREMGDATGISHALIALGSAAGMQGDYAAAGRLYSEGLELQRETGHPFYMGMALVGLGEAELNLGHDKEARPPLEESLAAFHEAGNRAGEAFTLYNLGYVALAEGDYGSAREMLSRSLKLRQELGNRQSMALSMAGLAEVACSEAKSGPGAAEASMRAATVLGAARALLEETGMRLSPADAARMERAAKLAHLGLDEAAWQSAQDKGKALSPDEAVALALATSH